MGHNETKDSSLRKEFDFRGRQKAKMGTEQSLPVAQLQSELNREAFMLINVLQSHGGQHLGRQSCHDVRPVHLPILKLFVLL